MEEAKKAVDSLNNTPISSDGVKLIVEPPKSKHQKPGASTTANNAAPNYKKEATRLFTVKQLNKTKTSRVRSSPNDNDDDDNDVWDDGLLPKHVHGNGRHSDSIVNGMTALDIIDADSVSLREMFVSEVT